MPRLTRTTRFAAVAAAASVAAATPALASTATPTLVAGPVAVKGYEMTIVVGAGSGERPVSLTLSLSRKAGDATQQHLYSFSLPASTYRANVKGATLDTGAELGRFGRIVATFRPTSTVKGTVPTGCTGKPGKLLKGPLSGRPALALVLDSSFFRGVSRKSVPASLSVGGTLRCSGGTPGTPGQPSNAGATTLSGTLAADELTTVTVTRSADGSVDQSAVVFEAQAASAPATILHVISQPGAPESFSVAAGLASANAAFGGPFLSGSLAFSSALPAGGSMASGSLGGDLVARFDSIGERTPAASGELIGVLSQS